MGEAARDTDAVVSAAARFGVAVEVKEPAPFVVWRENAEMFGLFIGCATQWRTGGMSGHPTGLDYAGVRQVVAALGLEWTAVVLDDLQTMERAALKAWSEKRRRAEANRPTGRRRGHGKGADK